MFTRTLSLGKTINRFYHPLSDSFLAPRADFDSFVISTLDSCFVDLITSYPMSLYFIGQSIVCWYHRHLELLARFNCRFEEFSGFSPSLLKSLSFSTSTSGDNHNFNRRSYILTFVLHNNYQSKICYKPRSTANDLFFYNLTQEFVVPKTDLGVSLPETFDYGEYGFSRFIPAHALSGSNTKRSQYNDGMLLYFLWIFGFTDCTYENFVFDGNHHVLVDFETAFTGFFRHSGSDSLKLSPRSIFNLSSTRTTLLPYWELTFEDSLSQDVSCFGNYIFKRLPISSPWFHLNTDYMLYKANSNLTSPDESSVLLNYDSDVVSNLINGFDYALTTLQPHISDYVDKLVFSKSLTSRFIFRDTASYSIFLFDLYSGFSLSSPDSYFTTLDKLDRLAIDHPSSDFVSWIVENEKLQLFNQDIPYFFTDTKASSLSCIFDSYHHFSTIYFSGSELAYAISRSSWLSKLQPLLIETSIKSQQNSGPYSVDYSPFPHNELLSPHIFDSFGSLFDALINTCLIDDLSVEYPFLLSFKSGPNRKNVQMHDVDYSFFNGYLGILYCICVYDFILLSASPNRALIFLKCFSMSFLSYSPTFVGAQSLGLSNGPGFLFGLHLLSAYFPQLPVKDHLNISSLHFPVFSSKNVSPDVSPDLFFGLSGNLISCLAQQPSADDTQLLSLVGTILSYQNSKGHFFTSSSHGSVIPLGIAHGVHGICISLLHAYNLTKSESIRLTIHRLVQAYDLFNSDLVDKFNSNLSWCSGIMGHLVTLKLLENTFSDFVIPHSTLSKCLSSVCVVKSFSEVDFCCGLSGLVASLLYFRSDYDGCFNQQLSCEIDRLSSILLSMYKKSLETSPYVIFTPSLLNGFSIFSLLQSVLVHDSEYLDPLVILKPC
jgi:lantibiotic modifying enzyme